MRSKKRQQWMLLLLVPVAVAVIVIGYAAWEAGQESGTQRPGASGLAPGAGGVGAGGVGAGAARGPGSTALPDVTGGVPREPALVAEGVYVLGGLEPSVAYVIRTSQGLILVDSGLDATGGRVLMQLKGLGLDPQQLKLIVLTHAHGDHVLGARRLRELTGARIHAGSGDCDVLRAGGPREAFFSTFHMPGIQLHATPIDVALEGGEWLELGDTRLEALATPGHTPGSMCYRLERNGQRILFTGDTISALTSDIGTYAIHLSPRYRGNPEDYLKTLQGFLAGPPPDLVCTGHPHQGATPDRPRVTPAGWRALLTGAIADVQEAIRRRQVDGPDFLDGEPKELLAGLLYLGDRGGYPVYAVETGQGLLLVDAPAGDAPAGDAPADKAATGEASGGGRLESWVAQRLAGLGREDAEIAWVALTSPGGPGAAGLSGLDARRVELVGGPAAESWRAAAGGEWRQCDPPDLASRCGVEVRSVPLAGRDPAGTGYLLEWRGKRVLFTGRQLYRLVADNVQPWGAAFREPGGDLAIYLESLGGLRSLQPDLWLPGLPIHDQNANLYGGEWQQVIDETRQVAEYWLKNQPLPSSGR